MIGEPTLLHELLQEAYTTDMNADGALAAWALRIADLLSEQQSPDSKVTFIREAIIACYPWATPPEFTNGMQLDPAMIWCFAVMVAHASVSFNNSLTELLHGRRTRVRRGLQDEPAHLIKKIAEKSQALASLLEDCLCPDPAQRLTISQVMLRALCPTPAYKSFADQEPAPNGVCLRFLLTTPLQERPLLMQQLAAASRLHLNDQQEWRMPLKSFGTFNPSYNLVSVRSSAHHM